MTTDDRLPQTRQQLQELERETVQRLAGIDGSNDAPRIDGATGRLTHIDAYQQHQMTLHGRRNLQTKLERIRAALTRLRTGTYGKCVECGVEIAPERLEFMPEAPFCVKCHDRFG